MDKISVRDVPRNWWLLAVGSVLTLGLAPFHEPHVIGKLKWVAGGAIGMGPMDWFDLALHGVPWLLLFSLVLYWIITRLIRS